MRTTAVLFATVVLFATACGSSSETTAVSNERGDTADGGSSQGDTGSGDSGDFCSQLEDVSSDNVSIDEDPDAARAAAEQLRGLAESAPPEIAEAIGVFADLIDTMAGMDADDEEAGMDAFGEVMELMFNPEVIQAAGTLEAYLVEECGLDAAEAEQLFGTDGLTGGPDVSIPEGDDQFPDVGEGTSGDDDPNDISLDDMEALEEANASASWTQKTSSTGIANDQYITLSTTGSGDTAFTESEALEACEAIRLEFEARQPALEIEILNGETVVAMGSAGAPCSAV